MDRLADRPAPVVMVSLVQRCPRTVRGGGQACTCAQRAELMTERRRGFPFNFSTFPLCLPTGAFIIAIGTATTPLTIGSMTIDPGQSAGLAVVSHYE